MEAAAAWLPLVGLVLGGACAAVWALVAPLGPWVAAMSVLVASILLTGAFHEDGLADTADALGGAHDRARIFVILKDSRVGAFGALALVISVASRLVLLAELGGATRASALAAAPAGLAGGCGGREHRRLRNPPRAHPGSARAPTVARRRAARPRARRRRALGVLPARRLWERPPAHRLAAFPRPLARCGGVGRRARPGTRPSRRHRRTLTRCRRRIRRRAAAIAGHSVAARQGNPRGQRRQPIARSGGRLPPAEKFRTGWLVLAVGVLAGSSARLWLGGGRRHFTGCGGGCGRPCRT